MPLPPDHWHTQVIQVDSTVGGQLHYDAEAAAASTVLGAGGGGQDAAADPKVLVQTNKGFMPLNKTHAQVGVAWSGRSGRRRDT